MRKKPVVNETLSPKRCKKSPLKTGLKNPTRQDIRRKLHEHELCGVQEFFWGKQHIHLPSTENASSTLPGMPPHWPYPESTYNITPALTGPATSSEPPRAFCPLTVSYSRAVS